MRLKIAVVVALLLWWHPALAPQLSAPTTPAIEWPEIEPPIPPRPHIARVEWLYKVKQAGGQTNVTMAIIEVARNQYLRFLGVPPVVTGTTVGWEYERDPISGVPDNTHLRGCAVDTRLWGVSLELAQDLSQAIAAEIHATVDPQVRVILWYDHPRRADHIHIGIQHCGEPGPLRAMWSLNQREIPQWSVSRLQ